MATRMLLALVAGLAVGAAAGAWRGPAAAALVGALDPVGRLWLGALQMTLIPLVFSLLVSGLAATASAHATGRLGMRALLTFIAFLVGAGVLGGLAAPPLLARFPLDESLLAALRSESADARETAEAVRRMPTVAQMLTDVVPSNPVRAATQGSMLPLVVFALLLGLAATRLRAEHRDWMVHFFRVVAEAMTVLVHWIILVAPVGIFALAVALGARTGSAAVGALALYVALFSGLLIVATLGLYAAVSLAGGAPLGRFARAIAPAQAVAFSARSSLAALPAMIEAARVRLTLPPAAASFVLPLAVSTLRVSAPISWAVTLPFLARLYGVELGYAELVALVAAGILLSFSVPGLPSASLFLMAPFLSGLGIPLEALAIVIAADAIPDLFKTVLNVTGHMAAAVIVTKGSGEW